MKVLLIVPAYNEEKNIVSVIDAIKARGYDYVVIDDGSADETKALCEKNGFNIVSLPINLGLADGFQTGMKYAYRRGYDAALQFDADGQHEPAYIQALVASMEETGADIVIGSRFVAKKRHFSPRMAGSYLISGMIKLTTGKSIQDPTSGMRLYNKGMIELFATKHDMAPEPDTLAYCLRKHMKVVEVPVEMQERLSGKSYLTVSRSMLYMLRTCMSILLLQWFR